MALDLAMAGGRGRCVAVAALALALLGAGCADEQDPGFGRQDPPAQTSDTLPDCPAGGPDSTTPSAGCLGPDGQVLRP